MNGRTIPASGPGSDEPARCYASFEEAAADLREIVNAHGLELLAIFEAAGWKTRRCEGRRASETGSVVSLGLEDSNVAEAQQ